MDDANYHEKATYADVDAFPREEVEMNKNKCYDVVNTGVKGRRVATKESSNRKMILALFIVTIVLASSAIIAVLVLVSEVKSETASLDARMMSLLQISPGSPSEDQFQQLNASLEDLYLRISERNRTLQVLNDHIQHFLQLNNSNMLFRQEVSINISALTNQTEVFQRFFPISPSHFL